MLQARSPGPEEPVLQLPRWAAERAGELGRGYAEAITASGVRVLGDPAALAEPVTGQDGPVRAPAQVPVAVAADLVVGTLSSALGRGALLDPPGPQPRPERRVRDVRTRELLAEVGARVRRAARRRVRPGDG